MLYAQTVQKLMNHVGIRLLSSTTKSFAVGGRKTQLHVFGNKKNAELYQEALVLGLDYKLKSKKQQSFRAPLKQRYCYAYNNHGTCPKDNACPHPHVCQICAGKHCRKLCPKFKQKKYKQFTRDPSSSTPKPPISIKK